MDNVTTFFFLTDINECEEIEVPCTGNHVCVNRIGDYTCTMGKKNTLTMVIQILLLSFTDPTILIIIIICASGGLALMCIAPIIIAVTCYYYRRRKGDMKHSTSYDNLIPEDELQKEMIDVDENMYLHLEEEKSGQDVDKEKSKRGLGPDIERRIKMLHGEDGDSKPKPTSKDITVTYIDDVDMGDVSSDKNKWKSEKPSSKDEKKDLSYIDTVESDDKPNNEAMDKWKSAKRRSVDKMDVSYIDEVDSDNDKTKLLQKLSDKKSGPVKTIEDEDKKEDLSYIDKAESDNKTKVVGKNDKPLAKPSADIKDKFGHKSVESDIQRRIKALQGKGAQ